MSTRNKARAAEKNQNRESLPSARNEGEATPTARSVAEVSQMVEHATTDFKLYLDQLHDLLDRTGAGSAAATTMQALYDQVDTLLRISSESQAPNSLAASQVGSSGRNNCQSFVSQQSR